MVPCNCEKSVVVSRAWTGNLVILATSKSICHAQAPVTFDRVLEYVQLEVNETKIVQLVQSSGTQLVLGSEQIDRLKQVGASESLVQALQQSKAANVEPNSDAMDFILILDCSGSMNDKLADGKSKWQAAQRAAIDFVRAVPAGRRLALIAYGLDAQRQCESVDLLRPLQPISGQDTDVLCSTIENLRAMGHTPITRSLQMAGRQLGGSSGISSIVLIPDGMENCRADPVAEASKLVKQYEHLSLKSMSSDSAWEKTKRRKFPRSRSRKGKFISASNANELLVSIRRSRACQHRSRQGRNPPVASDRTGSLVGSPTLRR